MKSLNWRKIMTTKKTLLEKVAEWENASMPFDKTIDMFQELIDTGMAWNLQGMYGRTAERLIHAGFCTVKEGRAKSMYLEQEE